MPILYFLVVMFGDMIGSFTGMGGSLVIKPIFNMISPFPLEIVILCSNLSVLVMTITSIITSYYKHDIKLEKKLIYLGFGSCIGGLIGSIVLNSLFKYAEGIVKPLQITLILLSTILAIYYQSAGKTLKKPLTGHYFYGFLGSILGFLSVLLGIGGGAINVGLLMWLTGVKLKQATTYSLISVFAAITIRIMTSFNTSVIHHLSLSIVFIFIIAAICGGIGGILLKRYFKNKHYKQLYIGALILALLVNMANYWL